MKRSLSIVALVVLTGLGEQAAEAQTQTGRIQGTITNAANGIGVSGADVWLEGTRVRALTRDDGQFVLVGVDPGVYTLRVVRIGYGDQEAQVPVIGGETTEVNFALELKAVDLDEIVATGYGTTTRRDLTGAVSSISGDELEVKAAPTPTVANALQGRAAGVQVLTASGFPGAGTSVRVRGTNSLTANSEPLYVVDGIPLTKGTSSSDPTQNPLVTINPNDIESIEILKDASATAIYGSRGANGVILITTRRGGERGNVVTVESSYGVQTATKTIDVLNAQQYRELRNEAMINVGQSPQYSDEEVSGASTTDYPSLLLRSASQQNHSLTFSGSSGGTRYLVSGNFLDQEGIVRGTDFRRYAGRVNLERNFTDRFRAGTNINMTWIRHNLSQVENGQLAGNSRGLLAAMVYDPALPVRDENGDYIRQAVLGEFVDNPVATVNELIDRRNETRVVGSLFGEYALTSDFRLQNRFAVNFWDAYNPFYAPSDIQQGFQTNGSANVWQGRSTELLNETLLTYERADVGPGDVTLLGGFTIQDSDFNFTNVGAADFLVEDPMWNSLQGGAQRPTVSSGASESN
ncbi:MAG: TonB-dependent receptor plug domain-containing protein, partial [Gemmatimonadales bacterium]|nr:TonB-dependent receptor plug domain-containing protein [Gemmatimonadales bacterium]